MSEKVTMYDLSRAALNAVSGDDPIRVQVVMDGGAVTAVFIQAERLDEKGKVLGFQDLLAFKSDQIYRKNEELCRKK